MRRAAAAALLAAAALCPMAAEPLRVAQLDVGGEILDVEGTLRELDAKVVGNEIRIALAADVLFDFDKHELKPAAHDKLAKVGEVLKAHPKTRVTIEGHTDGKGAAAYNQTLSERRAAAVRDWLVNNARQSKSRFATRGFGMSKPVAPNAKPDGGDDPDGRARNRRVEIVILQK